VPPATRLIRERGRNRLLVERHGGLSTRANVHEIEWVRSDGPPGIGREPLPASLGRADIAAGAAYLRHLRTPPENASPDPLGRRLRPNAPGTEGTPPPALAAAAFLARHAPSDAHPDHAWRAVRTAYPLRQPIAQAILRWSERYAELLLEQNMN